MSEKKQILKSASIISLVTFASRILGYVRDQRITLLLGTTLSADSFVLMAAIEHSHPGLHYDDNNLSLHPNRPRTIRVHHPHDSVDPAGFTARIPFEGETFTADACASVD